jgi:hypothetical protein
MSNDAKDQKADRALDQKKVHLLDQEKKVWQEIMSLTAELEKASKEPPETKTQESKQLKTPEAAQKLTMMIQKLTDLEISFSGSKSHLNLRLLPDGTWQLRSKPS